MIREELIFVATCDISGLARGKGFPARELPFLLRVAAPVPKGDRAQFEQEHGLPGGQVYGGIQDLHVEGTVGKDVLFSIDGHALWDFNDYDVKVQLAKPNLGYIKAGYTEFRSWYDDNGGFFPHNDVFFDPPYPEMHVDRGDAWIELGLRAPEWPEITIRYDHEFRFGQKDSTVWGDTNLTGLAVQPTRKIVPSFRNLDEKRDILSFEASKTIGNTDVLLGMRYEHNTNDYSLNMERGAGQLPPMGRPAWHRPSSLVSNISTSCASVPWRGASFLPRRAK